MAVMITRLSAILFPPILTGSISDRCFVRFLHISIGSPASAIRYVGGMTGG